MLGTVIAVTLLAAVGGTGLGGLGSEEIHVEAGGNTACEIFHNCQLIKPADSFGGEFCLQGEDAVEKPGLEGHIVGDGAAEGHCGMGVGVFEAGHKEVSLQVDFSFKSGGIGSFGAYVCDFIVIDPDLMAGDIEISVHGKKLAVIKAYHIIFSFHSSVKKQSFFHVAGLVSI